jgi:hypothetical protein
MFRRPPSSSKLFSERKFPSSSPPPPPTLSGEFPHLRQGGRKEGERREEGGSKDGGRREDGCGLRRDLIRVERWGSRETFEGGVSSLSS